MRAIRVDGKLRFASDQNTGLKLDTLLISPGGELTIGTAQEPIGPGHEVRITFTDSGPIDVSRDPTQLGRGLI